MFHLIFYFQLVKYDTRKILKFRILIFFIALLNFLLISVCWDFFFLWYIKSFVRKSSFDIP